MHYGVNEMITLAQKKYSFDTDTLAKIGKGVLIALGGVTGTYIIESVTQIDFGKWTPLVVAGCSILINICREYVKGSK